tara:strand:+ start:52 stop:1101 length:1050 start_codon:yes stop_codon:yes gene_type:complete
MANDSKNGIRSLVREPDALQTALLQQIKDNQLSVDRSREALTQRKRRIVEEQPDKDFIYKMSQAMGPYGEQYIDPSRAVTVPTGKWTYGIRGLYIPPESAEGNWERGREGREKRYGELFKSAGVEMTPDTAYGLASDITPTADSTWAHEFRHRAFDKLEQEAMERDEDWSDIPNDITTALQFPEERWNLIFDAWRARTPEDWQRVISSWQVENKKLTKDESASGGIGWKYPTKEEASDDLKKTVNANALTLINLEVQARKGMRQRILDELKEKNIPIPDIPEFDEDKEKNRLIERANSRALSVGRDELELTGWKDIPGSFFFWNRGLLRPKKKKEKTLYEKLYEILERD